MSSFIASVTVSVVMSILSAAGSNIVPMTDCILNLRARYPSTWGRASSSGRHGRAKETADQIREPSIDEETGREIEVVVYYGETEDGAGDDARHGEKVWKRVYVFTDQQGGLLVRRRTRGGRAGGRPITKCTMEERGAIQRARHRRGFDE